MTSDSGVSPDPADSIVAINVRLSSLLHRELTERAKRANRSLQRQIIGSLEGYIDLAQRYEELERRSADLQQQVTRLTEQQQLVEAENERLRTQLAQVPHAQATAMADSLAQLVAHLTDQHRHALHQLTQQFLHELRASRHSVAEPAGSRVQAHARAPIPARRRRRL